MNTLNPNRAPTLDRAEREALRRTLDLELLAREDRVRRNLPRRPGGGA